jgi:hypothetical protein
LTAKIQHDSKSEAEQTILIIQTYTRITCNSYAKTNHHTPQSISLFQPQHFAHFLGLTRYAHTKTVYIQPSEAAAFSNVKELGMFIDVYDNVGNSRVIERCFCGEELTSSWLRVVSVKF